MKHESGKVSPRGSLGIYQLQTSVLETSLVRTAGAELLT